MNYKKEDYKDISLHIAVSILGAFFIAVGSSLFLTPNQLSFGGISGIVVIFYYLFNISIGVGMFVINIPLFLFSGYKFGKIFLLKSVIGTMFLSIFIEVFNLFEPVTYNKLVACIYGGIFVGIGTAFILKVRSSTGGTDLISYIVKLYYPNFKIGTVIAVIDIAIVLLNMLVLGDLNVGIYSFIEIFLAGKIIDVLIYKEENIRN